MSDAIDNLEAALRRAMAGRPAVGGFPYLAETLRRAGVTRNLWFLPACQSLYLTEQGPVLRSRKPGHSDQPRQGQAIPRAPNRGQMVMEDRSGLRGWKREEESKQAAGVSLVVPGNSRGRRRRRRTRTIEEVSIPLRKSQAAPWRCCGLPRVFRWIQMLSRTPSANSTSTRNDPP
jgi:hypothetical protein